MQEMFMVYSESKLELNMKKVELEWCKKKNLSEIIRYLFCTKTWTSDTHVWVLSD